MSWTTVPKPGAQSYTNVNPVSKQQYDQSDITYDSSSTYYDSENLIAWNRVTTPSVAWNLSIAQFKASYSVAAQTTAPEYAYFSPDGVYMFVGDGVGGKTVYTYTLSTPWDVSTKTYSTSAIFAETTYIEGIFFKEDGLKMYLLNNAASDTVNEYNLSIAWNINSTTLVTSFNITQLNSNTSNTGIYFRPDGARMYIVGDTGNALYEFRLSTPWSVSSTVLNQSFSFSAQTTFPDGVFFKSDGTRFYISQYTNPSTVFEYMVSDPWNIGTASYSTSLVVANSDLHLFSIFFRGNGLQMFLVTATTSNIREYTFPQRWTNIAKPT